jgi:hypothetical protein
LDARLHVSVPSSGCGSKKEIACTVANCGPLAIILFATALPAHSAAVSDPPVKKSHAGICHDRTSPSYSSVRHFEPFNSIQECLTSGGRLPKNLPRAAVSSNSARHDGAHDIRIQKKFDPSLARDGKKLNLPMIAGVVGLAGGVGLLLQLSRKRRWLRKYLRAEASRAAREFKQRGYEFPSDSGLPNRTPRRLHWNAWKHRKRFGADTAEEKRAERAWKLHKLESDEDVFKRRYHRWDPWLKRIGYFDVNDKKK